MESIQPPPFVHLHVHSEYSLLDGSIKIKKLVKESVKQGFGAIALTDHDGMHGVLEFYLACQGEKINPIIGYEINLAPMFLKLKNESVHLVLLAQNELGYKNLIKLCTYSNTLGTDLNFKGSTSVDIETLKKYSSGLICLTGCMNGELSRHLLNNDIQSASEYLDNLIDIFGRENLFVELIDNGLPEQKILVKKCAHIAAQKNLELVATADVHYLKKDDKETHLSLLAIKHKLQKSDVKNFPDDVHFYLKTAQEMHELFSEYPTALENTKKIADRCQIKIDTKSVYMPNYTDGSNETADECLIRLSREGLEHRKETIQAWHKDSFNDATWDAYKERLEYELSVIIKMKFAGYFLIVADFINWAKNNHIPVGPGRGSAAGSLVTYALKITNIDPIRFNLLFERFLNPERVSMPDIDTDFCQDRREDVLKYVYHKYGHGAVSQIVTFGRMMAKNALKNLARITGWSFNDSNDFAKLIPESPGITLEQAYQEEPKIEERLKNDERAQNLWQGALEIEGTLSSLGIHAAGVIISDKNLDERCPLLESEGQLLTQFEHKYAEKVGLIKFDFLGLKTLTVIDKTLKIIKGRSGTIIDVENLDLDDPRVYKMISTAHVTGVFQLESTGMRKLIADLKPTCFTDIIAVLALFRPGPLGSGMVDDFVKRKHGQTEVEMPFDELEPILNDTYGVIVYQEQVQKIAAVLASYSLGEADLLRRAMGKKDKNEMERQKNRFVAGCVQNGHDSKRSEDLFDLMAKFAEYGFNKSHTAAYGWVTFQTAWLKTYYPTEFMAAIMSCDLDNTDKIVTYVNDVRRMNIILLPPCVNHSEYEFSIPADSTIRFGLGAIKGLGKNVVELIVNERKNNGAFKTIPEFIARCDPRKLNKKVMESLVKAGAFDNINKNRNEIISNSDMWIKSIAKETERTEQSMFGLFDSMAHMHPNQNIQNLIHSVQTKHCIDWTHQEKCAHELTQLGFYMTHHPAQFYAKDIRQFSQVSLKNLPQHVEDASVPDFKRKIIKISGVVTWTMEKRNKDNDAFLVFRLEDESNSIELTLFSKQYAALQKPIVVGDALIVETKIKSGIELGTVRGVVQGIYHIADKRCETAKHLIVKASEVFISKEENILDLIKETKKFPGKVPLYLSVNLKNENSVVRGQIKNVGVTLNDECLYALEKINPGELVIEPGY